MQEGLHNIESVRNPLPTMTHKDLFWKKDVLIVQKKSLKRLVKEFIFSKVADQKPAALQKISLITVIFEEFFLKFPEHVFHRIHFELLLHEIIQLALSYRGTPRHGYTFGPASIMLDTKSGENKLLQSCSYNIRNKT